MMITVKLFAYFREKRGKVLYLDEKIFHTPNDVCKELNIDPEQVGILLINGFHAKFDVPLKNGDLVSLFPPVAGG
ncbi:MAG: MoaD/ThiS family protein [Clostridiaceae bacterium]|nr:MoaD/ThiS family protein [Bacillota bacterium]NLN52385.1 MoaD/ThiS family protein [Clostridiaceae bacterium]